jgi:hypothetical protein
MAVSKGKETLPAGKAKCSSVAVVEAQSSHELLHQPAGKRKVAELSATDGLSAPAARRPAPGPLFHEGSAAPGTRDVPAAGSFAPRRVGRRVTQW